MANLREKNNNPWIPGAFLGLNVLGHVVITVLGIVNHDPTAIVAQVPFITVEVVSAQIIKDSLEKRKSVRGLREGGVDYIMECHYFQVRVPF